MTSDQMPVGFLMALAQNQSATAVFGKMSEAQRQEVIQKARQASSRQEMQQVVRNLGQNTTA